MVYRLLGASFRQVASLGKSAATGNPGLQAIGSFIGLGKSAARGNPGLQVIGSLISASLGKSRRREILAYSAILLENKEEPRSRASFVWRINRNMPLITTTSRYSFVFLYCRTRKGFKKWGGGHEKLWSGGVLGRGVSLCLERAQGRMWLRLGIGHALSVWGDWTPCQMQPRKVG